MKINLIKLIPCLAIILSACSAAPVKTESQTVYLKKHTYKNADTHSYMISDSEIKKIRNKGINPLFEISLPDLKDLYPAYNPVPGAPLIGIVLNREDKDYMIPATYISAIIKTGARVRLLSFENILPQLKGLDGIVLTGGDFDFPGEWYMPYSNQQLPVRYHQFPIIKERYKAYKLLLDYAMQNKMPTLGICAGMQIMSMELGAPNAKLYFDLYTVTTIGHRSKPHFEKAHGIKIEKDSKLYSIIGQESMQVNSRHFQGVVPSSIIGLSALKPTAIAPDGIIEAMEFPQYPNFLAVQFHPESLAYEGDTPSQKIFNAFVKQSIIFKQGK